MVFESVWNCREVDENNVSTACIVTIFRIWNCRKKLKIRMVNCVLWRYLELQRKKSNFEMHFFLIQEHFRVSPVCLLKCVICMSAEVCHLYVCWSVSPVCLLKSFIVYSVTCMLAEEFHCVVSHLYVGWRVSLCSQSPVCRLVSFIV